MAYIVSLLSIALVVILHIAINKADEDNERKIEALHKEGYELVDKYYGDRPVLAKAKKAEIDVMVHDAYAEVGRKYETKKLKEVSTPAERKKYNDKGYAQFNEERARVLELIDEIQMASATEEDLRPYKKVSRNEGLERCARETAKMLGISYEEAYKRAVKNYSAV